MTNSKEKSAHTYQKRKEKSAYYYLYDEEEKYKNTETKKKKILSCLVNDSAEYSAIGTILH